MKTKTKDPFHALEFAGCMLLVGVVVALIGIGLDVVVDLYLRTLP
jgi:hypothetical protein